MTVIKTDIRAWLVGAAIAASVPVFDSLINFDPEVITDWRKWAVGIGAGSVRQVAIYITAQIAIARRER